MGNHLIMKAGKLSHNEIELDAKVRKSHLSYLI